MNVDGASQGNPGPSGYRVVFRDSRCRFVAVIVDQENLEAVEEIKSPVVFCVAAWFGKVRLLDNVEIDV
ncbi:hypothetical protein IFM89_024980 [Coptis chinensis]|uniref:Uncharacterized protein n=1 Tax=Coptis chinensis TaxID=261450 RepID=A0A835HY68_9MAGN|nr:hypothetical protein IFM89_024980 [Coptis chinensis]